MYFAGYDLVEWLMDRLDIEDGTEALHLATLLCCYGYFFPVTDTKTLSVKDDGTLYRFQVGTVCVVGDEFSLSGVWVLAVIPLFQTDLSISNL